jgi:hypothetical protein
MNPQDDLVEDFPIELVAVGFLVVPKFRPPTIDHRLRDPCEVALVVIHREVKEA